MALRINTNVASLNAHRNMIKNDNALNSSLERLSTGLRINKAADDTSGMAIADSLKAQFLGLGQAIRNANDGISIVQTADGALDEAINIVNTIKTKAIQAAQDGQTFESRKKIQSDIDKLLEEVDLIANTTSFNGKKLLSGQFTNKKFQVGATSGETVGISIASAETTKLGHVTSSKLTVSDTGELSLKIHSNVQNADFELQAVDMQYNNSKENGIGALASVLNKLSDQLGISAQAVVETTSNGAVNAGSIGNDFKINGVEIGAVTVATNDIDGALVSAINQKSDQTGVSGSVDANGVLTLTAADGRGIKIEGDVSTVMGQSAGEMSSFGEIRLTQRGANSLLITTVGSGQAVGGNITTSAADYLVTSDMTLAADSTLASGSTIAAGSTLGFNLTDDALASDITLTQDALIKTGSILETGSTIAKGTVMGGLTQIAATGSLTQDGHLKAGSTLANGSTLAAGTVVSTDIQTAGGVVEAGTKLSVDTTLTANVILEADMIVEDGSSLAADSKAAAGSYFGDNVTTSADVTVTEDFTLKKDSVLEASADASMSLAIGSELGGEVTLGAATTVIQGMTLAAGSTLEDSSTIAKGSTLGFDVTTGGVTTLDAATELKAGSTIVTGSTLAKGTYLTQDILVDDGGVSKTIEAGTTLEQDVTLAADLNLETDMVLAKDSELAAASTIAANGGGGLTNAEVSEGEVHRLFEIDVTTQEGAQIAISIADSALASYDAIRADLGSVQNQLSSTIANLSVTKVNVQSAESNIRDVDFAEEAMNFSKMQILAQSGSYAMAQANASAQNVMSLLQ